MGNFEPSTDSANEPIPLPGVERISSATGPDFICAGMPKAGTTWLFEQVFHHPDFWMSPIKEYHFFDTDFPKSTLVDFIRESRENPHVLNRRRGRMGHPQLTDRDQRSFDDILSCSSNGTDLDEYARLFREKNGQLSGDITPGYCVLDDLAIARIAKAFPKLKIIFLIRDPVARSWSRMAMRDRRHGFLADKFDDLVRFQASLVNSGSTVAGFQSEIFSRWKAHFPEAQIRHFFFDELEVSPKKTRRKILSFLGADPSKESGFIEPSHNRKSKQKKIEMPEAIRTFLIDYFAEDMRASVDVFGPRARTWLRRYGLHQDGADPAQERDEREIDVSESD